MSKFSKQDMAKEANNLEKMGDSEKSMDAFATELNGLKPDFKLAVMNQIQADQKDGKAPGLPQVDFYTSGDVQSVTINGSDGKPAHSVIYNQASGKRLLAADHNHVADTVKTYDPVTGQLVLEQMAFSDKGGLIGIHNRDTGKLEVEYTKYRYGKSARYLEYDANGNQTVAEYTSYDGSVAHTEFQNKQRTERLDVDDKGNKVEQFWDPSTGHRVVMHISNVDGSGTFWKFDSNDGHVVSINNKDKDGTITKWHE